jgi:hypothetical protein
VFLSVSLSVLRAVRLSAEVEREGRIMNVTTLLMPSRSLDLWEFQGKNKNTTSHTKNPVLP